MNKALKLFETPEPDGLKSMAERAHKWSCTLFLRFRKMIKIDSRWNSSATPNSTLETKVFKRKVKKISCWMSSNSPASLSSLCMAIIWLWKVLPRIIVRYEQFPQVQYDSDRQNPAKPKEVLLKVASTSTSRKLLFLSDLGKFPTFLDIYIYSIYVYHDNDISETSYETTSCLICDPWNIQNEHCPLSGRLCNRHPAGLDELSVIAAPTLLVLKGLVGVFNL